MYHDLVTKVDILEDAHTNREAARVV